MLIVLHSTRARSYAQAHAHIYTPIQLNAYPPLPLDDDDMDVSGMFDETDMRTVFDDPNPSFSSSSSSPSPGLVSSTGSSDAAASPLVKSDGSAVASSTPHSTPQLDLNLDNLDNFTTNNDEANRNAINNMSTQTHTGRNAHMGGKSSVNLNQLQDFNDSLDGMGSQNKISALNTLNNENQVRGYTQLSKLRTGIHGTGFLQ